MRRPRLHQKVSVVAGPYAGLTGRVCRMLHRRTPESWVDLDERPDGMHFPFADDDTRRCHALIDWADMVPR